MGHEKHAEGAGESLDPTDVETRAHETSPGEWTMQWVATPQPRFSRAVYAAAAMFQNFT